MRCPSCGARRIPKDDVSPAGPRLRDTGRHDESSRQHPLPSRRVRGAGLGTLVELSVPECESRPYAAAWAIAFGLFFATLLLYAPVLRFEFIHYDDPYYVTLHPRVSR